MAPLATDGPAVVGMASAEALRSEGKAGPVIPGGCFLSYLFIVPERWGEGIGGAILNAVLVETKRRDYSRIHLCIRSRGWPGWSDNAEDLLTMRRAADKQHR